MKKFFAIFAFWRWFKKAPVAVSSQTIEADTQSLQTLPSSSVNSSTVVSNDPRVIALAAYKAAISNHNKVN